MRSLIAVLTFLVALSVSFGFRQPVRAVIRPLNWHLSALEAAENAELEWTRVQSNMRIGAYEILVAEGALEDPEWPELSMDELLDIAFKNKIINRSDHLVLLQLRGLA